MTATVEMEVQKMKRLFVVGAALLALGECGGALPISLRPRPITRRRPILPPSTMERLLSRCERRRRVRERRTWDTAGSTKPYRRPGRRHASVAITRSRHFVIGVEGDIDWASISGTNSTVTCPTGCKTGDSWLSTVRGRVGYAADRFLPYLTGGAAFGNIQATTAGLTTSSTNAGWTVGGGVEFAITPNWSAKAEYLYRQRSASSIAALNCGAVTDSSAFSTNICSAAVSSTASEIGNNNPRERKAKPPGAEPRGFSCLASTSSFHRRRGIRGHMRGKIVEPSNKARMHRHGQFPPKRRSR